MTSTTIRDWDAYEHAYGSAGDVPALLHAAEYAPEHQPFGAEPWFSLWSALCHQDDIYSASYRAMPDLVRIASRRSDVARWEALLLAAAIQTAAHRVGAPTVPTELRAPLAAACTEALALMQRTAVPADAMLARIHAIASAAFAGDIARSESLLDDIDPFPTGPD